MCNSDIRKEIENAGVKHWQIADKLGCADGTLCRKLRHELTTEEKERIRGIITELKECK